MKRGKVLKSGGISLPNGRAMKSLLDGGFYRYLGVLQANEVKQKKVKEKVTKEYKRQREWRESNQSYQYMGYTGNKIEH